MLSQASSEAWVRKRRATNGHLRLCLAPPSGGRCPERLRVPLVVEGVSSAGGDEPRPAVDTEGAALPPRHIVLGAVAVPDRQTRVHYAAALWTVTHRRVAPPVVHALAGDARA